jgi:phosphopantetheinyl transferase (holo-ACP synthase)
MHAKKPTFFPETFFEDEANKVYVASLDKFIGTAADIKIQTTGLIHQMLELNLGSPTEIQYDQFGKPWLEDPSIGFSLSHSREYLAIVLSKKYEPGIDVETIRPTLEKIVPRLLHPSEQKFLDDCSDRQMALQFIWGAKEAVYKSWGKRGLNFADEMVLEPFQTNGNDTLTCHFKKDDLHWIYTLQAIAFPGNYLVVTTSVSDQNTY